MRLTAFAAAIGLVFAAISASTASAQERIDYGPFYMLQSDPTTLYLDGFLAPSSAQALYDALKDVQPTTLVLNSTGGAAIDAMVVAELVADNRINTIVPEDASCTSVCFFVAIAGWERTIDGTLSMHRWVDPTTQYFMTTEEMNAIEEDALARYGASADLIALFAGMPDETIFTFTRELLSSFAVNRTAAEAAAHFEDSPMHQVLPTPQLPIEFLRLGEDVTGLFTVTNAGQAPQDIATGTRLGIAVPEEPTGAVVFQAALTPDVEPVATTLLTFGTGQYDGIARFGTVLDFAVIYPPAWQQVDELVTVAGTERLTDLGLIFFLLDDTPLEGDGDMDLGRSERFLMLVPTIYQEHARRALEKRRLVVYLFFANGTEFQVTIPVTAEARAVFDEALAAWE